jgi:hypothetical protein
MNETTRQTPAEVAAYARVRRPMTCAEVAAYARARRPGRVRRAYRKLTATAPLRFARHVARAGRALATDRRIPRWLRVVLVIACLPIPGPVDNAVQVFALVIVAVWYRPVLRSAWSTTHDGK